MTVVGSRRRAAAISSQIHGARRAGRRPRSRGTAWRGDRRWAFVRDGQVRSGFPWLTIRGTARDGALPALLYRTGPGPNASATLVRTPSGGELDVADPALAAELGFRCRVIKQDRGIFDTIAPVAADHADPWPASPGSPAPGWPPKRFRPNLLVDCRRIRLPRGRLGRPGCCASAGLADAGGPA